MKKFSPKTKMQVTCSRCDETEMIMLGDLPTSPGGKFLFTGQFTCFHCLGGACGEIREENVVYETEQKRLGGRNETITR